MLDGTNVSPWSYDRPLEGKRGDAGSITSSDQGRGRGVRGLCRGRMDGPEAPRTSLRGDYTKISVWL